ncbi:MAG: hypothetical protein LC754_18935 [Acidobacteria bacterium]|nr:hypothetical protein [Acidobacteriota bacterium]
MKPESEIWQVMTQGEVYQADLETLKEWISEGLVGRADAVRKGNLKWIEAGRAPLLRRVFTGEEKIVPREPAVVAGDEVSGTHAPGHVSEAATVRQLFDDIAGEHVEEPFLIPLPTQAGVAASSVAAACCYNHPGESPEYVCRECATPFCRRCAKFVGSSTVVLCALCGELCRRFDDVRQRQELREEQSSGFGLADFKRALAYPFGHPISLVFGAGLYGFTLLAGLRGRVLAFAILFGCISIVINRVACGKLDRDFLPDFSAFSFLDDVIMPVILGLGVTFVALGPAILLALALVFGWLGGLKSHAHTTDEQFRQMQKQAQEQAQKVAGEKLDGNDIDAIASGNQQKQEEVVRRMNEPRPESVFGQAGSGDAVKTEGGLGKKVEESDDGHDMTLTFGLQFLKRPGFILILGLLAIGWAILYYPMALAVAGYTEDFKSVINPLVGLDTIRHMGMTYGRAFAMYLVVQAAALVVGIGVSIATAPFDMPFFGNLPATFINGTLTFYSSLVIACVLGLALFKSADRLGIDV